MFTTEKTGKIVHFETRKLNVNGNDVSLIYALTDTGKLFYLSGNYWFQVPPLCDQRLMKMEDGKPAVVKIDEPIL